MTNGLSPDSHFSVGFPYLSNLNAMKNGKDSSYCEAKLGGEHYEKKLPGHEFAMPRVYRKEKVMGCHPVSFQKSADEIQYFFQSFILYFQTFSCFREGQDVLYKRKKHGCQLRLYAV